MSNAQVKKARILIASSSEALEIARAIHENLERHAEVTQWDQGVFKPSNYTLESLLNVQVDYVIVVFHPDDVAIIREESSKVARDNVIFELGLFVGSLGRHNVFVVAPRGEPQMHIPTDLLGVMFVDYDRDRSDLVPALGAACNKILHQIKAQGLENGGCINNRSCSHALLMNKVTDKNAQDNLRRMYDLHKNIAEKNSFVTSGDTPDALLMRYLIEYPMTRYVTALRDYHDDGMLYLRSEPRMSVALQMISNAKEEILAVSVLSDDPWHLLGSDSPFVDANIEAARKGVKIYRVYVVENHDPGNNLDAIVSQSKAAGINLHFQFKNSLRTRLRSLGLHTPIVNMLICDRRVLTYSLENDTDHDGHLVVNQGKINAYLQQFDFIWRASSDEFPV